MASDPLKYPYLKPPCRFLVAGASGTGKSRLVQQFLENQEHIFGIKFSVIRYCISEPDDIYYELAATFPNLEIVEGIPADYIENPGAYKKRSEHHLLILDDLARSAAKCPAVDDLFTKVARHWNITVFLISQNIYHKGPHLREISLNCTVLVLTKNNRDPGQIATLAKQLEPQNPKFVIDAYNKAMQLRPFGYLVVDLSIETPPHQKYWTGGLHNRSARYYFRPKN
jgi:nucleoside-triphosphatase THEP1